jgi:hypothetical protein
MTALYGIDSINLPHVDLYKWAEKKKIRLPLNFRKTVEEEKLFLKLLAMRQYFVRLPPDQEKARFSEAMKEAMKHLPSNGFSDKTVIIFQIAGTFFFAVFYVINVTLKRN